MWWVHRWTGQVTTLGNGAEKYPANIYPIHHLCKSFSHIMIHDIDMTFFFTILSESNMPTIQNNRCLLRTFMEVVSCLLRLRYWLKCIGMANPGAGYPGFKAEDIPILFKWKKHRFNLPGRVRGTQMSSLWVKVLST